MPRSPAKGEIYRLRDGGTSQSKPRPVLVVSRIELNGGKYLIAAPFTTKKIDQRKDRGQYVLFKPGDFGLTDECVLQLDLISLFEFTQINVAGGVVGKVSTEKMEQIDIAIRYVFAL